MGYYSVTAWSRDTLGFEKHRVVLDPGHNVFNILTDDIESVVKDLQQQGVKHVRATQLDGLGPINPVDSLALPGEAIPEGLLGVPPEDEEAAEE